VVPLAPQTIEVAALIKWPVISLGDQMHPEVAVISWEAVRADGLCLQVATVCPQEVCDHLETPSQGREQGHLVAIPVDLAG